MGRNISDPESAVRDRVSPRKRNSSRRSPSRRGKSPVRHRSSHMASSLEREKHSSRAKSPKHASPRSPISHSPSPRTKRLRRALSEREEEKGREREHERNNGRGSEKTNHREKEREREREKEKAREKERGRAPDRETGNERKERRPGRDGMDERSSRARRERSTSPSEHHHRSRHRSRSLQPVAGSRAHDEAMHSRGAEGQSDQDDSLAKMKEAEEALEAKKKEKPSFELSGKLAAETNRVKGVTLLFSEPPEARKPDVRWRLYVFKGGEVLNEPLYIHRQSCYLFGRERRVADIPTDHPSCSKQHAVIQFRQVEKEQPDGTFSKQPRVCTIARELCWGIGINRQLQNVFLSSNNEFFLIYIDFVMGRRRYFNSYRGALFGIGKVFCKMRQFVGFESNPIYTGSLLVIQTSNYLRDGFDSFYVFSLFFFVIF